MKNFFRQVFVIIFVLFLSKESNGQVTVTSSDSLSCTNLCTTLTANLVGDAPTDAGITSDDVYSPPHALGFSFNYYGTAYTSVLIGANANLCFDLSLAGAFDPWTISAALLGNPSKFNCICGPWCDIDFADYGGTCTYSSIGTAPNRRYIVTYCRAAMFTSTSCPGEWTTTQIILYEGSNLIEVHTAHKTICTAWNNGRAICGVQNSTGTAATVAPARDWTPNWAVVNEAWRFTPNSTATAYTVSSIPFAPVPYASSAIHWYNYTTGAYIGTGTSITVCPTTRTTYRAGALGCADTSFGYYTVTPGGSIIITTSSTNPTLCGACDGTITVSGLTPGLSDTITYDRGGVPQTPVIGVVSGAGTLTITGLCAGSYTNIRGHQGGCLSLPHTETLVDPPIAITSVVTNDPTRCGDCNGSIILSGLYPSHVFTVSYSFNGVPQTPVGTSTTSAGTITLNGLCAGVYSNIVASFGSCITPPVGPYTLTDPPIAISGVTKVDPNLCGVCNGSLTLEGLYPTHVFTVTYTFNGVAQPPVPTSTNGSGRIVLNGLCEGLYTNIIASFGTCITPPAGPVTLTAPPPPVFAITANSSPTQCGFCNGSVTIMSIPPYTADTIYYSKDGVPQPPAVAVAYTDSTLKLSGLCSGTYSGFSVKIGPCLSPVTGSAILINPPMSAGFTNAIHLGCNGDTVFYSNTSTSTGPLHYIWRFGDGVTDTTSNPRHIFAQGVYTVTLIATNYACTDSAKAEHTLIHPVKSIFTQTPDLICQNNSVSFTNASVGSGLSYLWSFGNGATSSAQNPSYLYQNTGQYKVQLIVTDYVPCSDTAYNFVQVDSLSPISISVTDSVLCKSTYVTFTAKYTSIGNEGITWYFGSGDSVKNVNPVVHAFDGTGKFTVSANALFRECRDTGTSRTVTVYASPDVYLGEDTTICPGSVALELRDKHADKYTNALWKWNTGQTTPYIRVVEPGTYYLDASTDGCHSTDTIKVENDCYINIPNVFSPNGDGMNDYFFPRQYLARGLTAFKMSIYNRWGQVLFETTRLDGAGWDGRFNGQEQTAGVYVYSIDATFKDGQKEHHQGNITLLR